MFVTVHAAMRSGCENSVSLHIQLSRKQLHQQYSTQYIKRLQNDLLIDSDTMKSANSNWASEATVSQEFIQHAYLL
jgi:hypothetical protein